MDYQKPKFQLYAIRSFGEKFTATFDFFSENWKVILRFMAYLVLPLCVLMAYPVNGLMRFLFTEVASGSVEHISSSIIVFYAVLLVGGMLVGVLSPSIAYGLMKLYDTRPDRLQGLTMGEFRPVLLNMVRRMCLLLLAYIGFFVVGVLVLVGFALITPALAVVGYIALLLACLPLMLVPPAYLLEDNTLLQAFGKGMRYGFKTWGGIFALFLVIVIIVYIISGIVSVPWLMATMVGIVPGMTGEGVQDGLAASQAFGFVAYLMGIVQFFFSYFASVLLLIAMGVQYGHAAEKLDSVSVAHDVAHFEDLADHNRDADGLFAGKDDLDNFDKL